MPGYKQPIHSGLEVGTVTKRSAAALRVVGWIPARNKGGVFFFGQNMYRGRNYYSNSFQ